MVYTKLVVPKVFPADKYLPASSSKFCANRIYKFIIFCVIKKLTILLIEDKFASMLDLCEWIYMLTSLRYLKIALNLKCLLIKLKIMKFWK